jgi:hypothetical protein
MTLQYNSVTISHILELIQQKRHSILHSTHNSNTALSETTVLTRPPILPVMCGPTLKAEWPCLWKCVYRRLKFGQLSIPKVCHLVEK